MTKRLIPLCLILLAAPVFSQDVNLAGSWEAFKVSALSRYSLSEHQNPQAISKAGTITFNSDGTVASDLQNWTAQKWQMEAGFLMLITPTGNVLYYPRELATNIYFLVQVEVIEKNREVIAITSKSLGNLLLLKP